MTSAANLLCIDRRLTPPPHRGGGASHRHVVSAWLVAAGIVAAVGVVLFGRSALFVLSVSLVAALGFDVAVGLVARRPPVGGALHSALLGLLVGLTLPATVPWYVAATGAAAAVGTKAVFGGIGHYIWHPALVGRVLVQFLFAYQLALGPSTPPAPVLAAGRLLVGDLFRASHASSVAHPGWALATPARGADALLLERPVQALRRFADGRSETDDQLRFTPLLRDVLPPWRDTLLGTVPGGIGETSCIALLVAGLYLIYRQCVRWQLPAAMLAAAALAAAILPVQTAVDAESYRWFPALVVEDGRPVGLAYVLHHLTCGQLMIGAFLLAGDMMTTPLRVRGQLIFAAVAGILTIFMRLYGLLDGECYWSILIANTLVPAIDRHVKRPVLGLSPLPVR